MPDERLMRLGKRIRELRVQRDLTLERLAEKASLSANYLGELERSKSNASVKTLLRIADALGVNLTALFSPLDGPRSKDELAGRIKELVDELAKAD